jgi:hypothetical protein
MAFGPDDDLPKARDLKTVDKLEDMDAEELRILPDEKLVELYKSTQAKCCVCEECNRVTLFVAATGHNCSSQCHNCGKEYYISG